MNINQHSNLLNGGAMGSWSLSSRGSAIIISSGVVAVQGKDEDATADFSLRYEWLKSEIEKNPNASEYQMTKYSPITLAVAVRQNKLDMLGTLEVITKTIDVPYELKRAYLEVPQSGRDLLRKKYRSQPWDISLVQKKW